MPDITMHDPQAELPSDDDPWPAINRERWRLIRRSVEDTFTPLEREQLDALEAYADAYLKPLAMSKRDPKNNPDAATGCGDDQRFSEAEVDVMREMTGNKVLDKCPETDALMIQAWVDCLRWASAHEEIGELFKAESGITIRTARTPLDRMIAQATGFDESVSMQFIDWFNVKVWGDIHAAE